MPADTLKRIDPQAVPEMYRRLGMRPMTCRVGEPDEDCGCLLGALARYQGVACSEDQTSLAVENLIGKGWNLSYIDGLWQGFDGHDDIKQFYGADPRARALGYRDGQAANVALQAAGMMQVRKVPNAR